MRACIILIEDPLYTPGIVKKLIENKLLNIRVVIIPSGFISLKRIYSTFLIYGIKKFLITVFKVLYSSFKGGINQNLFKKAGVKVVKTKSVNSKLIINELKKANLDIIISNNCPQRIKEEILKIPKLASINVHLGLLPKYRGLFPLFHAFIRNEKEVGVSIHYMNVNFDDGDILSQAKIPIEIDDDLFSLYEKAFNLVPDLINNALLVINKKSKSNPLENKKSESSYYSYPVFKEIMIYRNKTKNLK